MALELPGRLVVAFNSMGLPWPGIDEDELRAWARGVRSFADEVNAGTGRAGSVVAGLAAGSESSFTRALEARWERYGRLVAGLRGPLDDFATALDAAAGAVVVQKKAVIAAAAALTGKAAVPAEVAAERRLARLALQELEAALVGKLVNDGVHLASGHVSRFISGLLNSAVPVAMEVQSLKISYAALRKAASEIRGHATETGDAVTAAYKENASRNVSDPGEGGEWPVARVVEEALLGVATDLFKSLPGVIFRVMRETAGKLDQAAQELEKTDQALAFFREHIGDSGGFLWSDPAQGADEVLNDWKRLTPSELDAVLNSLTPAEFRQLNGQLGEGSSWWGAGGPANSVRTAFANLVFGAADAGALARVEQYLPRLEPDPATQYQSHLSYAGLSYPLFPPNGVNVEEDLVQGDDGDCWFLSGLGTLVMHDPGFLANHIHENDNGTYTVTFYQSGKPVDITVDGRLPAYSSGGIAYAQQAGNSIWAAIYEKAYAQFKGGYGAIDGGYGNTALRDLTGTDAWRHSPGDFSLAQVDAMMQQGTVLTTSTKSDMNLWDKLFGGGPGTEDNFQLVTSHEYMIKSVNMNGHPPTITVVNPWGSRGSEDKHVMPQEVTLTDQQWQEYFDGVSGTKP